MSWDPRCWFGFHRWIGSVRYPKDTGIVAERHCTRYTCNIMQTLVIDMFFGIVKWKTIHGIEQRQQLEEKIYHGD